MIIKAKQFNLRMNSRRDLIQIKNPGEVTEEVTKYPLEKQGKGQGKSGGEESRQRKQWL